MKKVLIFASLLILALSCTDFEMQKLLIGEWSCTSWINTSKGTDKCNNNVYFNFRTDFTYFSEIGSVKDSGTYKVSEEMLFVTPKGKHEFAVKIDRVNADSLVFVMSQAGEGEILTLIKKR